ncbi:NB-ARC domains-containing protein [Artemisia annua]|uniref:NB-ARC domains-containing protein n=1 Tax=Artemisia annua TaxID=35608 RepID=A0A2U1PVQ6_ARTAN|nr:NB-ARC domains-containing protein [Artemisia annua]
MGSFLRDKDNLEWEDAIDRLKTETIEKLKLSYDDLEEDYKEIFLDAACILKGWTKDAAVIALKSCGFPARKGLTVLELKSLITISKHGELDMHDHIEEMGKNIVRRVNPNKPEMHSRLWIEEEIVDILAKSSGNQATKCIRLNAYGLNFEILMNGLANMKELRFLNVCNRHVYRSDVSNWNFDEDSLHLPDALRFLSWSCYPFSSLPKTFQANNLVGLEMDDSNIIQLWKDGKEKALKLRFLKFRLSQFRTLDLSVAPNLETLTLERCDNLEEGHFQVTPNLKKLCIDRCYKLKKLHMPPESPKLKSLNLLENSKLTTLHLGKTPNLETLNLYRCADMVELRMPAESPKLRSLNIDRSKLTTLHLGETPNLETLILQECTRMVELCMPAECPKLVTLDLYNLELRTLHLGISPNLVKVRLQDSPMVELHMPAECPKLVNLDLSFLRLTTLRLENTPSLETLNLQRCTEMVELAECPKLVNLKLFDLNLTTPHIRQILTKCRKLVNLDLSFLDLMTLRLGINPNLEKLSVNNCTDMVELHIATDCPKLVTLNLDYNVKLRTLDLGLTPYLERLGLYRCYDLEEINASAECLKKLIHLNISNCGRFKYFKFDKEAPKDLYRLEYLEELHLRSADIKNLPDSLCMLKHLKSLEINSCRLLEKLPEDIGRLQCLKKLIVKDCKILRDIPNSICEMDHLECLDLTYCTRIEELPEEIGRLECLKELDIRGTGITRLPKSIYQLKGLCIKGRSDDREDWHKR